MVLWATPRRTHERNAEHEQEHATAYENAESDGRLPERQRDDERDYDQQERPENAFVVRIHRRNCSNSRATFDAVPLARALLGATGRNP